MSHKGEIITPQMLPPSDWEFINDFDSALYSELDVCREWGIRPSKMGMCEPHQDFSLMKRYLFARNLRAGYEAMLQEREREKLTAK
jgi:hypothetical protein